MPQPVSLARLASYFLRLGATGFGGPVALANAMRRDLVEVRGWLSDGEYDLGLAIAAACPGPLAYQLGVYCGYIRFGIVGGLAVALAFGLAPFVLVVAVAAAYGRFADAWPVRAVFYGVAPVVVALILKACWNLGRKTLRRDTPAWVLAAVACAVTVVVQKELAPLFLVAGLAGAVLFARPAMAPSPPPPPPRLTPGAPPAYAALPFASLGGGMTTQLFLFFFKTGCLVFGSGLVIVPFLKTYVVDQYHWLGNREFLDAVAIGMISPGPVVITATFVGYLVAGFRGAVAATVGIFTPAVLFTVVATPLVTRHGRGPRFSGFIRGVTVAVVGVLVGTTSLVARAAIGDALTLALAAASLVVLAVARKVPEPVVVLAGALAGLVAFPLLQPAWLLNEKEPHPMSSAQPGREPLVVFVCEHGAAKSVVAAAHFNRLAAERGLAVRAVARGTDPQPAIAPSAARGLLTDGIDVAGFTPQRITQPDVDHAARVVTLGCALAGVTAPGDGSLQSWDDVPAVGDGYPAARDAILRHLETLLDELARRTSS